MTMETMMYHALWSSESKTNSKPQAKDVTIASPKINMSHAILYLFISLKNGMQLSSTSKAKVNFK